MSDGRNMYDSLTYAQHTAIKCRQCYKMHLPYETAKYDDDCMSSEMDMTMIEMMTVKRLRSKIMHDRAT
jgi:hypothetical protein